MKGRITTILILIALLRWTFNGAQQSKFFLNLSSFFGNVTNDRVFMRKLNFTQINVMALFMSYLSN